MKEFKCANGYTYIVKDTSCLVCDHCTDIFYDYTNGPYMVVCGIHDIPITDGSCKDYKQEKEN